MVGPIASGEFIAGDFESLAAYEHHKRVQPVHEALLAVHEHITEATKCVAAAVNPLRAAR